MLTSKQRAQLRGLAAGEDTILHVGKAGLGENVVTQAREALAARELVKGRVLDNSPLSAREACDQLAALCQAEGSPGHREQIYSLQEEREGSPKRPYPGRGR